MLGKGYIFQIYFPFFAEASISYAFVFIAVFDTLKLLDQMLLLQSVIYVNRVRLILQPLSSKGKHIVGTPCICIGKGASRLLRLAKSLSSKTLAVSSNLIVLKAFSFQWFVASSFHFYLVS